MGSFRRQVSSSGSVSTRPSSRETRLRRSAAMKRIAPESPVQEIASASSFANRRGGPIGSPALLTGTTQSAPSLVKAIMLPSGDQAGPSVPLDPIERWGNGVTLRSGEPSREMRRISFRPSRKREEYRLKAETATTVPSEDQVARPGPRSGACRSNTSPETTSTSLSAPSPRKKQRGSCRETRPDRSQRQGGR